MKNVLIAGSSGMIGSIILQQCLVRDDIKTVTVINRRRSQLSNPKLVEVIHNDFTNFAAIEQHFKAKDVCFYCVGVYTGQVPRDEFRKITVDYTKTFADALKNHSPSATFCFLSGAGADESEKSPVMFAKDKGIAENYLLSLHFSNTHLFRPAYIYPVTPRKEPNFSYKIFRVLYPLLKLVFDRGVITSEELASAMIIVGMNGGDKIIYENKDIKKLIA